MWHDETVDLTPYMSGNLPFRFRATMSGSDEDANVDNVRLVASGPALAAATTGVGTAPLGGWSEDEEDEPSILPDILLPV